MRDCLFHSPRIDNTKVIVFRVNSPGGSIIASEMMRDELLAAKSKGIKVVVSMGDYAASGGVYISTPAEYIFAEPTTITGSIGVAIALPTLEGAMDYIGVDFDGVVTSKHGGWDPTQAIDDDLDKIFAGWGARTLSPPRGAWRGSRRSLAAAGTPARHQRRVRFLPPRGRSLPALRTIRIYQDILGQ